MPGELARRPSTSVKQCLAEDRPGAVGEQAGGLPSAAGSSETSAGSASAARTSVWQVNSCTVCVMTLTLGAEQFGAARTIPAASWRHAFAAALATQGFNAIGTTSLGVAAALGLPDGAAATAAATVALARRLGRGTFQFTVDAEGGFSDDPEEVGELARRLHDAGAAGINLEDGRSDGSLASVELHAAKIAAVKASVPALFVNARTDTHWLGRQEEETAERLAVYEQAGADGVFVPGLSDPDGIAALIGALVVPLNILYSPTGPDLTELAALGVRRISLGSLLYRRALAAAVTTATDIRDGRPTDLSAPSYDEVQATSVLRAVGSRT